MGCVICPHQLLPLLEIISQICHGAPSCTCFRYLPKCHLFSEIVPGHPLFCFHSKHSLSPLFSWIPFYSTFCHLAYHESNCYMLIISFLPLNYKLHEGRHIFSSLQYRQYSIKICWLSMKINTNEQMIKFCDSMGARTRIQFGDYFSRSFCYATIISLIIFNLLPFPA